MKTLINNIVQAVVKELNAYSTCPFDRHSQILGDCPKCGDQLLFAMFEMDRSKGKLDFQLICDNCGYEITDFYISTTSLEYCPEQKRGG